MRNVKVRWHDGTVHANTVQNTYIISINVTNKQKEMYYQQYVPELLNVSPLPSHPHLLTLGRACKA
jgi:hypothetical protein